MKKIRKTKTMKGTAIFNIMQTDIIRIFGGLVRNSAFYIFLIWAINRQATLSFMCSSYCSWSFIPKQTLLNRDRLLKHSLSPASHKDIHLASHLFLPHLIGEYKMPHRGTVWCAYRSRLCHPCFRIHNSPSKKTHQCLCSLSLYRSTTANSRGHTRFFQELLELHVTV